MSDNLVIKEKWNMTSDQMIYGLAFYSKTQDLIKVLHHEIYYCRNNENSHIRIQLIFGNPTCFVWRLAGLGEGRTLC